MNGESGECSCNFIMFGIRHALTVPNALENQVVSLSCDRRARKMANIVLVKFAFRHVALAEWARNGSAVVPPTIRITAKRD